jgi:hypothetical protein
MRREGVHGIVYVHNACNPRLGKSTQAAVTAMLATLTTPEKREELSRRLVVVLTQCTDSLTKTKFITQMPPKLCDMFQLCNVPLIWCDDVSPNKSLLQKLGSMMNVWSISWKSKFADWIYNLPLEIIFVPSETEREGLKKEHRMGNGKEGEEIRTLEVEIDRMKEDLRRNHEISASFQVDVEHAFVPEKEEFKLSKLLKEAESLTANIEQMEKRLEKLKNLKEGCFSASSLVTVRNMGLVEMKDIHVGDIVATKTGWSIVSTFLHWHDSHTVDAIRLEHEDGALTLSPNHLVSVTDERGRNKGYISAQNVGPDMFLESADGKASQVLSTEYVRMDGYYAPLTEDGTIIVDGVVASCYMQDAISPMSHWILHASTKAYSFLYRGKFEDVPSEGTYHSMIADGHGALLAIIND